MYSAKCTRKGRVVYDRKPHLFSVRDVSRVMETVNNHLTQAQAEKYPGVIRYILTLATNMYSRVAHLFHGITKQTKSPTPENIKAINSMLEGFIDSVARLFGAQVATIWPEGSVAAEAIFREIGLLINNTVRRMFIGETDLDEQLYIPEGDSISEQSKPRPGEKPARPSRPETPLSITMSSSSTGL